MSVVGIDFGNLNCVVAVARKRGIDVLANEASQRQTRSVVAFRDDQRCLGEKAATQMMSNLPNTITDLKLLLGRKWSDPQLQELIKSVPFTVKQMEGDNVGVEVDYQGQTQIFSVEQIVAMMLTQLRKTVEADSKGSIKVKELVISVPSNFTDAQRRALKDAAEIAGISCHQLLAEPTALAIPYGMYKKDLPDESDPLLVLFVNFGHATLSASVVSFSNTVLRVLSSVNENVGGRDLDQALFDHFQKVILDEYKLDISNNNRAKLRLMTQCEKVKRVLTGNAEAPLFVESIMNDVDVRSMIKRDDFEQLSAPAFEKVAACVQKAIAEANLSKPLNFCEVVGGSSYVPAFQSCVQAACGMELSHTQNKYESIAKGCALQCAVISPQFHINRNVTVKDYIPYTIRVTWKELETGDSKSAVLFKKGDSLPTAKRITFKKSNLEISADYDNPSELPPNAPTHIGKFTIPKFSNTVADPESTHFEVKFKLDGSGIFSMDYARAIETYYEIEQPKPAEKPAETPAAAPAATEENKEAAPAETPAAEPEKKDADGDTVMEEPKKKKKTVTTNLVISAVLASGIPKDVLRDLANKEQAMQAADELSIATGEAKNALEGYAYDSQGKLQYDFSEWTPYATEEEKNKFMAAIDDVITWLYGEGDASTKEIYSTKLSELKVLGDPLEQRKYEDETRPLVLEELIAAMKPYEEFVQTTDEKYAHITPEDRQKITDKVQEVKDWVSKMQEKQDALPKNATPVFLCSAINQKKSDMQFFCNPITNKPKPKPKPEEKPKTEEPKPEEAKPAETTESAEQKPDQMEETEPKQDEGPKVEEIPSSGPESMDVD